MMFSGEEHELFEAAACGCLESIKGIKANGLEDKYDNWVYLNLK